MLLASLGLHGLVLFTPVAPSEDDLVPPPASEEEDGIALTKIEAPSPSGAATPPSTTPNVRTPNGGGNTATGGATQPNNRTGGNTRSNNTGGNTRQTTNSGSNRGRNNNRGGTGSNNNAAANATVPDLPTPPLKSEAELAFEEYFEVFEGYRGLKTITNAAELKTDWLNSFAESGTANSELDPQALSLSERVPYAAGICLPSAPDPFQVLVLVKTDGSLDEYQQTLQSTGYREFDKAARTLVQKHSFADAGAPTAYQVNVEVDYDAAACQSPRGVINLPSAYFDLLDNYTGPESTSQREAEAAKAAWVEQLVASGDEIDFSAANQPESESSESEQPEADAPSGSEAPASEQPEAETSSGSNTDTDPDTESEAEPEAGAQPKAESEPEPSDSETPSDSDDVEAEPSESQSSPQSEESQEIDVPEFNFGELGKRVDYDFLNICLPIQPKDAWWGVVLAPDGTLVGEADQLRSTGYSSFDARSKEVIDSYNFPEAETTRAYTVIVPVRYSSNCKLPTEAVVVSADANATTSDTPPKPDSDSSSANNTDTPGDTPESQDLAFNPARQEQLLATGQQNLSDSSFGSINNTPDFAAAIAESDWPENIDRSSFLAAIDPENGLVPVDGAETAFLLTRNADLAPESLAELYGVEANLASEEYQGAPLYELTEDGVPQLFASVVSIGDGGGTTVVVIWPADPRQSSEAVPHTTPESAEEPTETEDSEDSEDAVEPTDSGEPAEETLDAPAEVEEVESEEASPEPEPETPPAAPEAPRGLGMLLRRQGAEALESL